MATLADKSGKYARRERERRFLLSEMPGRPIPVRVAQIVDRYITGTRLRLRRSVEVSGGDEAVVFKLTQKIPADDGSPGLITTLYLSDDEHRVLDTLPGSPLKKTRYSIPPFGVDVFDPPLDGLLLAEIEFDSDSAMEDFTPPEWSAGEATFDPRFTGGRLAQIGREDLRPWLREFGIALPSTPV